MVRRVASLYSGSITAASLRPVRFPPPSRRPPRAPSSPTALHVGSSPEGTILMAHQPASSTASPRARRPAASAAVYAPYDAPTHSFTPGAERRA